MFQLKTKNHDLDIVLQAKKKGISGNFKGDGWQNGGCLIVSAGGKDVLLNYVQENPAEHVALADVLKVAAIMQLLNKLTRIASQKSHLIRSLQFVIRKNCHSKSKFITL